MVAVASQRSSHEAAHLGAGEESGAHRFDDEAREEEDEQSPRRGRAHCPLAPEA